MNKILVVNDNICKCELDSSVICKEEAKNVLLAVNTLKIKVVEDTELNIVYNHSEEYKINIEIEVAECVNCKLTEFRSGASGKVKYHYILNQDSVVDLCKFYDVDSIKEFVKIDLNGVNATINYYFKTVSKNIEKYDLTIYHNALNTTSNIINNGVNINDGILTFNVSSFVLKGYKNCNVLQKSRIINLTDNKCQICPNLYIDEFDVNASHSAHIGTFKEEEIFYLMSRGITKEESVYLLIKGFLTDNMNSLSTEILEIIEKYWR